MNQATDLSEATPLPTGGNFRLQMEGMATAGLYVLFFGMMHMMSSLDVSTTKLAAVFLVGLIVIPLVVALPLVFLRGILAKEVEKQSSIAAFSPFLRVALYALQGLALWIVTREAYIWVFSA